MSNYLLGSAGRIRFLGIVLLLATVASMVLVACGGTSAAPAQSSPTTAATSQSSATSPATTVKVQIVEKNDKYSFDPATLTIKKGTQVVWTNASDAPHTITSDTGAFNTTSNLTQNQTFMSTFTTAGTFTYHCNVHPYMKASITVTS